MAATQAGDRAGPYSQIRSAQTMAFVMILLGFLLQWPTLHTLFVFQVLVVMFGRLAVTDEIEMRVAFGSDCDRYAAPALRLLPKLKNPMPALSCRVAAASG